MTRHLIAARLVDSFLSLVTRCGRGVTHADVTHPTDSDCEVCLASCAVEGAQANRRWKQLKEEAAGPRKRTPTPTKHGYPAGPPRAPKK